ncbi:cytochrome c oxidase assembly protein [Colletotrichum truncatum]|uniref:Cytochrome c oxidase assembly protein n=1 Tax=Colletotrichum truncatum TaxID=5467 RepID=A0ACC3ZDL7_COLTU|nr:cytochrome c oxidase assembly protein [Colletotrichum truncatum]KAF6794679.1 cytochrome c oxidase assembly protein [Colletotrichum truncatum]
MSRASKLTLAATSLFAASTIVIVHFQQKFEKEAMHQGVVRDIELQRVKRERQLDFEMQRALEEEYKREQTVQDSTATISGTSGGGRSLR